MARFETERTYIMVRHGDACALARVRCNTRARLG
jgi:hypothetical protein